MGKTIPRLQLRDLCGIPPEKFDEAETFLLSSGYVAGTMGEKSTSTPITSLKHANIPTEELRDFVTDGIQCSEPRFSRQV